MRLTKLPRAGAWAFVSLIGVGALLATYPGGAADLFRDLRDYTTNAERVNQGDLAKRDIDAQFALQNDREELKSQLRGQLARGEMTLAEAAELYSQALAAEPHLLAPFRRAMPGNSDEERAAANLIREVVTHQLVSVESRYGLLEQFQSRYGAAYPLELPNLSADELVVTRHQP